MPIKSESTPPQRIGKIGSYTVFVTPPATPNVQFQAAQTPIQLPSTPRVTAPPTQFDKEKPSSFTFFWDTVAKVQNVHSSLDEHVAHWRFHHSLLKANHHDAVLPIRLMHEHLDQLSVLIFTHLFKMLFNRFT
ncbi:hypothetical protein PHJA_000415800 [Phtheirospermum japonicum]|uniref:Uncharacterized protein n=1 Tax=Phtheirospermum japonicum TaxID=374723 RepID=A0A830B6N3_9LAMI|nr:hypothetical protein PHJA_000415800 [Phtheirospermum japonicum]